MVRVLIIDKEGNKKNTEIKKFKKKDLYKKCNLRKADDFKKRCTWKMKNSEYYVSIYAKDKGRANSENKYDLPPPLDNELYFGKLLLVKHTSENYEKDNVVDLTVEDWQKHYEKLFGGFESLDEEEESSSEEEIDPSMLTKEGYSKEDGFIVDDEEGDDDYIPQNEDDDEEDDDPTDAPAFEQPTSPDTPTISRGHMQYMGPEDDEFKYDYEDEYEEMESAPAPAEDSGDQGEDDSGDSDSVGSQETSSDININESTLKSEEEKSKDPPAEGKELEEKDKEDDEETSSDLRN